MRAALDSRPAAAAAAAAPYNEQADATTSRAAGAASSSGSGTTGVRSSVRDGSQHVRLSWMLVASPRRCDQAYWSSPEVQMLLLRVDRISVVMSLVSMATLCLVLAGRGISPSPAFKACLACAMLASGLHCLLLLRWPGAYVARRHAVVGAQRALRVVMLLTMQLRKGPVSGLLLAGGHHMQPGAPWVPLLTHCCFLPLSQFNTALFFSLAAPATLLGQFASTGMTAVLLRDLSVRLAALPGMQQLASDTCSTLRAVMELVLYVVVDQATMPGVPAAGVSAFGTQGHCHGPLAVQQLLLYSNLCISLLLPVYVCYVAELHHKLQFWRLKGARVVVAASPLLPLPARPWTSHVLVVMSSLLLLWFAAEALLPHLQPRAGAG